MPTNTKWWRHRGSKKKHPKKVRLADFVALAGNRPKVCLKYVQLFRADVRYSRDKKVQLGQDKGSALSAVLVPRPAARSPLR